MRSNIYMLSIIVGLSGCTSASPGTKTTTASPSDSAGEPAPETGTTDVGTTDSAAPSDPTLALSHGAAGFVETSRVATPDLCAECHSNSDGAAAMRRADGAEVAPYDLQHASMMANAGRDPLFWAVLSAEVAHAPSLEAELEATCLRCHAPLATAEAEATGAEVPSAAALRTDDTDLARLGRDGVSCTSCHRLDPDGLGEPETWSGHWQLDPGPSIYGPHADPFTNPMEHHTRFSPAEGAHMLTSELCASCHTLQTPTVVDGAASGHTFLEQATYLEWQHSAFGPGGATPAACQTCHFPSTEADGSPIHTAIARNPGGRDFPIEPRSPYGQHFQVGGNTFILGILRDNTELFQTRATPEAFDAVIARTRAMLQTAADLTITPAASGDAALDVQITIKNRSGHKLPSGYPARRAWLRLTVSDTTGETVFRSGHTDASGRIVGADEAPLPSELAEGPIQPHRSAIEGPDDVLVYQSIMAAPTGEPVFRLLHAAQMAKDNRLLPAGFPSGAASTPVGDLAPVGTADDGDFGPGQDVIDLRLTSLPGTAPHTVTVELVYQAVSPRYQAELALVDTPEVEAFATLAAEATQAPEVIATATATVP